MSIEVTDAPDRSRYEAHEGDVLLGFAEYTRDGGRITFTHTVVEDVAKGRGVASAIARSSLDEARAAGLRVRPLCPFYARWIENHPDYADLVDPEDRPAWPL
ncbi:GNAT family N-acetyltransferase [Glycomyces paridis]|uniref:N-acetyltransferase n=1 Tax=Glycomyces paridis TaxID=2126555 RepID=A0A4S8P6U3_9ACTN|nr:GNAT family N-acetyltransferase [Glycomyces paridis]THV23489.1 N-acetyltransferase [Glycomyces paridis]